MIVRREHVNKKDTTTSVRSHKSIDDSNNVLSICEICCDGLGGCSHVLVCFVFFVFVFLQTFNKTKQNRTKQNSEVRQGTYV